MTKFKVGDKVKITGNNTLSVNKIGDIGVVTECDTYGLWRVEVVDRGCSGNWTEESDMEIYEEFEYEDQWYLNDGKVEIPDGADKLENGS